MNFDYDSIPPGYYFEAMLKGIRPQRFWHEEKFREVIDSLPDATGKLLDVGCAAGSLTFLAASLRPNIEVTGVDVSASQVAFANSNIASLAPKSKFIAISATDLPFPNNSFDMVTSVELIEHLNSSENARLVAEVFRVLRPGGYWIVTTPNYRSFWPFLEVALNIWSPVKYNEQHLTLFHKQTLLKHLNDSGWKVEAIRTFFVFSPFVAWISRRIAKRLHSLEKAFNLPGSLLIARAKKPLEISA